MVEAVETPQKEARSLVRYLRISPRKVRLVINAIRRKPVGDALSTLAFLNKKAARLVEKGLQSALANAKGKGLEESRLVVSEIKADGGPTMKRLMTRAMGRADQILKRSTHLTIVLREGEKTFALPSAPPEAKGRKKKEIPKPKKEKQARAGAPKKRQKAAAQAA